MELTGLLLQKRGETSLSREEMLLYHEVYLRRGLPVRWTSKSDLRHGRTNLSHGILPAGSIAFMTTCMAVLGLQRPPIIYYPTALKPWFCRTLWTTTLGELREAPFSTPIFVKPAGQLKLFTGKVISTPEELDSLPKRPKLWVWCSTPVTWLAEWRVYVVAGEIRNISCYAGDESQPVPQKEIVDAIYELLSTGWHEKDFACDFGLLEDGRLALVEMGSGYSMGAYDISPADYLDMLTGWWGMTLHKRA